MWTERRAVRIGHFGALGIGEAVAFWERGVGGGRFCPHPDNFLLLTTIGTLPVSLHPAHCD